MILITSAKYISYGLASEFGRIPPCMLPVQNKRLYEHQISLMRCTFNDEIYLSLPSDYMLPEFDETRLHDLNVHIIRVNPDIDVTLSASIRCAIATINKLDAHLRILFGDTLFNSLPNSNDIYLYGTSEDDYKWDYSDNNHVYCGYFSFTDQNKLCTLMCIANDFTDAVYKYNLSGIESDGWLDFGLQNTYYRSISKFTTQRSFNTLDITRFSVIKRSKDTRKMQAEYNWFLNIPKNMKCYIPAVLDTFDDGYETEYFYLSSLANMYVYGENSYNTWVSIINACSSFISSEYLHHAEVPIDIAKVNNKLFTEKTKSRILKYSESINIDLNHKFVINDTQVPSINYIIDELDNDIEKCSIESLSIMHGDFCFSNILYDFKSQSIKVIDPRGLSGDGNEQSIYGDIRYDIAKLAHSIIGKYDFIIAGRFQYNEDSQYEINFSIYDNDNCRIANYFLDTVNRVYGITHRVIYPIMINLFLSMLPLHSDNELRQKAMLANALRLYLEYKSL